MKRILSLLLCVFLVSCSDGGREDPLIRETVCRTSLEDAFGELRGTAVLSRERLVFYPDHPDGVELSFSDSNASVSYLGMTFEGGTAELSRLKKVFDAVRSGSAELEFDEDRLFAVSSKDFKLKVTE